MEKNKKNKTGIVNVKFMTSQRRILKMNGYLLRFAVFKEASHWLPSVLTILIRYLFPFSFSSFLGLPLAPLADSLTKKEKKKKTYSASSTTKTCDGAPLLSTPFDRQ